MECGDEFFGVREDFGDFRVGCVGLGREAVIDAEEECDDVGRLVVAMVTEIAWEVELGFAAWVGEDEGAGGFAGERACGDAIGFWIEFGEKVGPFPTTVTFMGDSWTGTCGLMGAKHGEGGISRCGEQAGDFIGVDGTVREAVAEDEEPEWFF